MSEYIVHLWSAQQVSYSFGVWIIKKGKATTTFFLFIPIQKLGYSNQPCIDAIANSNDKSVFQAALTKFDFNGKWCCERSPYFKWAISPS